MTPLFIAIIILVIILLYFIYVTYYKQSFKDKLCVNCIGNSNITYLGSTANITGCNCDIYNVWCGNNTGCHDYTDLLGIINFTNGSFEADTIVNDFYPMTPSSWIGSGFIFIILTPNTTWTGFNALNGNYVCAIQNRSGTVTSISQYFRCSIGSSYTISFSVLTRPNDNDPTPSYHKIGVSIDGISYFTKNNLATSWASFSFQFSATQLNHLLKFTNLSTVNNTDYSYSIILDNITITQNNIFTNGSFDQDVVSGRKAMYPAGWFGSGLYNGYETNYVVKSGSSEYNNFTSVDNPNFVALFSYGGYIEQFIPTTIGSNYGIYLSISSIVGQSIGRIGVKINDVFTFESDMVFGLLTGLGWVYGSFVFKATTSSTKITIVNKSGALVTGYTTILIDCAYVLPYVGIFNGDFELNPSISTYSQSLPNGWTGTGNLPIIIKVPSSQWNIFTNISNSYICGLSNFGGISSSISQVMNMIIGKQYLISFYTNTHTGDIKSHSIEVLIDGVSKLLQNNLLSVWTKYYFIFKATKVSHLLTFSNASSNALTNIIFLDIITVEYIC
jgi:hypothetical protein